MASTSRPIVIVTGGNSGIGFAMSQCLVAQLSQKDPSNAHPLPNLGGDAAGISLVPWDGLTLVLACRNVAKAEAAHQKLHQFAETEVTQHRKWPSYDGHGDEFLQKLSIDVLPLDLAVLDSVFKFGHDVMRRYPYVSHLICNAGIISWAGVDNRLAVKEIMTDLIKAVTRPESYIQNIGEVSIDGLGLVWQCNVFGHYVLYHLLQDHLETRGAGAARVLWTTSLSTGPEFWDPEDWQCVCTTKSYQASKYQIELISSHLDWVCRQDLRGRVPIWHFMVHPGVAATNISVAVTNFFVELWKLALFYIVRGFGSSNKIAMSKYALSRHDGLVTISSYKAAISTVHVTLVQTVLIHFYPYTRSSNDDTSNAPYVPRIFVAQADRRGKEYIILEEVQGWAENEESTVKLVDLCEGLYQTSFQKFKQKRL
ncbi:3-keto sterol reductase [Neolentinus lepideus HHB14362 ss-1]|uniref:3-keto sterol reductase n=1 Tax=Neolentinus lepideus HHB14362 ss-1 TaxID=1314782 RepID=A0A165NZT3_9AGAM|nr:3-keto sterol reductase [Neolentinus lepideus HHB14362 ss-1]